MAHPMQHYGERSFQPPDKVTVRNGDEITWEGTIEEYGKALEALRSSVFVHVWRNPNGMLDAALPFEDMESGTYRLTKIKDPDER